MFSAWLWNSWRVWHLKSHISSLMHGKNLMGVKIQIQQIREWVWSTFHWRISLFLHSRAPWNSINYRLLFIFNAECYFLVISFHNQIFVGVLLKRESFPYCFSSILRCHWKLFSIMAAVIIFLIVPMFPVVANN